MEIKHTVEILTKDIQDIEKLVRNLNNYTTPPQIELDLAMSKLRNVYELLSMISKDSIEDLSKEQKKSEDYTEPEIRQEEVEPIEPDPMDIQDPPRETEAAYDQPEESIPEPEIETPPPADEEALKTEPEIDFEESKETKEEAKQKEAGILAEKFKKDTSLNEKIATGSNPNMDSKIKGGPIDSIKRNIGLNDRFLIIRELMNGDNEGFNLLIQKLDDCSNFNEAFSHIQARFPEHLEHDGLKILINLTRRKFISAGNV